MTHQEWIEAQHDRMLLEAGRMPSSWEFVAEVVFKCLFTLVAFCFLVFTMVNMLGHMAPRVIDGKACWLAPQYAWPIDGFEMRYTCVATIESSQP